MDDHSVWPPPPSNQDPPVSPEPATPKTRFSLRFLLLNIGLGLALALFDITQTDALPEWITEGVAVVLGFVNPKFAWISTIILTLSLYVVHVIAIRNGVLFPYVETSVDRALSCWEMLVPFGCCAFVGAIIKIIYGRVRRSRTIHDID